MAVKIIPSKFNSVKAVKILSGIMFSNTAAKPGLSGTFMVAFSFSVIPLPGSSQVATANPTIIASAEEAM